MSGIKSSRSTSCLRKEGSTRLGTRFLALEGKEKAIRRNGNSLNSKACDCPHKDTKHLTSLKKVSSGACTKNSVNTKSKKKLSNPSGGNHGHREKVVIVSKRSSSVSVVKSSCNLRKSVSVRKVSYSTSVVLSSDDEDSEESEEEVEDSDDEDDDRSTRSSRRTLLKRTTTSKVHHQKPKDKKTAQKAKAIKLLCEKLSSNTGKHASRELRPRFPYSSSHCLQQDWPTARAHRMASLNALAKVHVLYENEGRTVGENLNDADECTLIDFLNENSDEEEEDESKDKKEWKAAPSIGHQTTSIAKKNEKPTKKLDKLAELSKSGKKEKAKPKVTELDDSDECTLMDFLNESMDEEEEVKDKKKDAKSVSFGQLSSKKCDKPLKKNEKLSEMDKSTNKGKKLKGKPLKVVRRKKRKLQPDVEIIDTKICKRMARLNAQAILAASYVQEPKVKRTVKKPTNKQSECDLFGENENTLESNLDVIVIKTEKIDEDEPTVTPLLPLFAVQSPKALVPDVSVEKPSAEPKSKSLEKTEESKWSEVTVIENTATALPAVTRYTEVTKVHIQDTVKEEHKSERKLVTSKSNEDVAITQMYHYQSKSKNESYCVQMQTTYKPHYPPNYYGMQPYHHLYMDQRPQRESSAFSAVPRQQLHNYYQPAGPLIQPAAEHTIHKPVPFHPQPKPNPMPQPPQPTNQTEAISTQSSTFTDSKNSFIRPTKHVRSPVMPTLHSSHLSRTYQKRAQDPADLQSSKTDNPNVRRSLNPSAFVPGHLQQEKSCPSKVLQPTVSDGSTHAGCSQEKSWSYKSNAKGNCPPSVGHQYPGTYPGFKPHTYNKNHHQPIIRGEHMNLTEQQKKNWDQSQTGSISKDCRQTSTRERFNDYQEKTWDFKSSSKDRFQPSFAPVCKDTKGKILSPKPQTKDTHLPVVAGRYMDKPRDKTWGFTHNPHVFHSQPERNYSLTSKDSRLTGGYINMDTSRNKTWWNTPAYRTSTSSGSYNPSTPGGMYGQASTSFSTHNSGQSSKTMYNSPSRTLLDYPKMEKSSRPPSVIEIVEDTTTARDTKTYIQLEVPRNSHREKIVVVDVEDQDEMQVELTTRSKQDQATDRQEVPATPISSEGTEVKLEPFTEVEKTDQKIESPAVAQDIQRDVYTRPVGFSEDSQLEQQVIPAPLIPKIEKTTHGWSWEGTPCDKLVYISNDAPPCVRRCYPAIRHTEGDVIGERDCVLLRSGPRNTDLPFVAKVTALWENEVGDLTLSLLWYYRPEHTELEYRLRHSNDEVFASKHRDTNSVACIDDKCYVLTYSEYCRYRRWCKQDEAPSSSSQVVIPSGGEYPRAGRLPPRTIAQDRVLFCRRVYDYRQKRLLKNPL